MTYKCEFHWISLNAGLYQQPTGQQLIITDLSLSLLNHYRPAKSNYLLPKKNVLQYALTKLFFAWKCPWARLELSKNLCGLLWTHCVRKKKKHGILEIF